MQAQKIHLCCLCCFFLLFSIISSAHSAAVPALINYQGRITDTDSNPVTGTKKLTINIYDAVSGGTLLWGPQVFPTVPVINGYFNVILGPIETDDNGMALPAGDSINDAFASGTDCYLEVQVDAEPVVIARQRILSVPYAVQAEYAVTAQNVNMSGRCTWLIDSQWTTESELYCPSGHIAISGAASCTASVGGTQYAVQGITPIGFNTDEQATGYSANCLDTATAPRLRVLCCPY